MSKILDMAKTFEQTSKQQADDIESSLKPEFEKHEKVIKKALDSSRQSISDAIQDQQKRIGWLLLKSWGVMLISALLLLVATSGTLWYQGNLIAERQATLEELAKKGGKLILSDRCKDENGKHRFCIRMNVDEGKFGDDYMIPKGY